MSQIKIKKQGKHQQHNYEINQTKETAFSVWWHLPQIRSTTFYPSLWQTYLEDINTLFEKYSVKYAQMAKDYIGN